MLDMFGKRRSGRDNLFERAILSRKDRVVHRQRVGDASTFPWGPIALWTAFMLVGGYVLFFSPVLMVREVVIEGESIIPPTEYQERVEGEINGSILGVFKKRNFFFIPTDQIIANILGRYPKIVDASVERNFPDRLTLSVVETPTILRWCAGGPCYLVRDGRAVTDAYSDDARYDSIRLSIIDESALPVQLGQPLPVETFLATFSVLRAGLQRMTTGEPSFVALTPSRHSGELTLLTGEGWNLLVTTKRPAEETLGALRIFLDEYAQEGDRSKLRSIDLRVQGKVFYSQVGEPVVEVVTPPDATDTKDGSAEKKKKKNGR